MTISRQALDDGCELDVAATDLLKKVLKFVRIVGVIVVDDGHSVPVDTIAVEHVDSAHHPVKRRLAVAGPAVLVVKLLRPVNREADQPAVIAQEAAPLVGEQSAVGLDAVFNATSAGIALLQFDGALIE